MEGGEVELSVLLSEGRVSCVGNPGIKPFSFSWVIKWSSCTRIGRGPLHLPATHFPVAADSEGCHAASRGLGGRSSVTLPS